MHTGRPEYELLAKLRTASPEKAQKTKINLIDEDEAAGDTAAVYAYFREQTGRRDVPGILKCFGTNPEFLRQMIDMSSSLLFVDGYLTRRQKERIATLVSARNSCPYCADSHGFFALVHGSTKDTLHHLLQGRIAEAGLSPAEEQLLRFAQAVNDESFKITTEDVDELRKIGWKEEQIAEAVHVAAFMGFCNRVANAFGLPSQNFLTLKLGENK
ncbi:MAG TPA: peroxidase-related enzyme [Alloacidobacterium sp.]|nr:peroxidase-related enzyme [Alloacidobacterium sp.]